MKEPFLKGKLTAGSVAVLVLSQLPELAGELAKVPETFQNATQAPLSVVGLVAALGVIYGGIRRVFGYFQKGQ